MLSVQLSISNMLWGHPALKNLGFSKALSWCLSLKRNIIFFTHFNNFLTKYCNCYNRILDIYHIACLNYLNTLGIKLLLDIATICPYASEFQAIVQALAEHKMDFFTQRWRQVSEYDFKRVGVVLFTYILKLTYLNTSCFFQCI